MKLPRHKIKYKYYNVSPATRTTTETTVPTEVDLEYILPADADELEKRVQELEGLLSENAERLNYWKETAQQLRNCNEWLEKEKEELEGLILVTHNERCAHNAKLANRIEELEAALTRCHSVHVSPTACAELVDECFHELFPNEQNPHKK
jgi:DNA repair exonuclease SbcCD ATPase subunit